MVFVNPPLFCPVLACTKGGGGHICGILWYYYKQGTSKVSPLLHLICHIIFHNYMYAIDYSRAQPLLQKGRVQEGAGHGTRHTQGYDIASREYRANSMHMNVAHYYILFEHVA